MSEFINGQEGDFIETDCYIEFKGEKLFCNGGSYLVQRKDNKLLQGILYLREDKDSFYTVGTWDGSIQVKATCTKTWRSNLGDMRSHFTFKWNNKEFWGINAGDNCLVRCKEYKR